MRLRSLSRYASIGSLIGLLLLVALSLHGIEKLRQQRVEIARMIDLHQRLDSLSVASDSLLLFGADTNLWKAYIDEAEAVKNELLALGPTLPDAGKTLHRLETLIDAVAAADAGQGAGDTPAAARRDGGLAALDVPLRSRIVLNHVAGHGIAIATALDTLVRERYEAAGRLTARIAAWLAGAGLLFGALSVAAFPLIHRHVSGPVRALSSTLERIQAGDLGARAVVNSDDELANLARTLNRIPENREASDQRLRQYRMLVENSGDLFAIADSSYRYLLVNKAYAEMFALEPSAIEGRYLWDVVGRSYYDEIVGPRFDECLAGTAQRYETERQSAEHGIRHQLVRYFPLTADPGAPPQVIAAITDITELKQAETKLREQGNLLEIAGRVGRFGGWTVDLATSRSSWSDVIAEIHGMPRGFAPSVDDGIGFYAPEFRERIREVFTACAERGVPYDEELQIINTQGQRVWVRTTGEPVRDAQGEIVSVEGSFQDISGKKNAELEAKALTEKLRTTLESITDAFFTIDPGGRFTYLNTEAEHLLRRGRKELLGTVIWDAFAPARGTLFEREYRRAIAEQRPVAFEEYYEPYEAWYEVRAYPSPDGLAVYFRDVTERREFFEDLRRKEKALQVSRDRLVELVRTRKALIDSLPASIALLDTKGKIVEVNDQWRRFAKHNAYDDRRVGVGRNYLAICEGAAGECSEEAPAVAQGLRSVLAGDTNTFSLEYPCHAPDEQRWFRLSASPLERANQRGAPIGIAVMHVDITERKLAERKLEDLAYEDSLTGLLSLNGFAQALSMRLATGGRDPHAMLVILDVKDLRHVNETYGYQVGDQLLIKLGQWLAELAGTEGLVGRVGGDEFALLLRLPPGQRPDQGLAALSTLAEQPFELNHSKIAIAIDVGYTLIGESQRPAEDLLREAELALFEQRAARTPSPVAYSEALGRQVRDRIEMARELRIALAEGQLELHFQPKNDLKTGRIISCEALLRWNHPERGLQPPAKFIPVAEQSQLIVPIGDWVLHEACRLLDQWQSEGLDVVRVAVNVSVVQLAMGDLPKRVRACLDAFDLPPGVLTVEITESVFERESHRLRRQIDELRGMGIRLSLDDFGTGYSSLLYLQQYPFDEIKVDRAFVSRILDDAYSREVVSSVLGLAAALGAEVVAEGIESDAVRAELFKLGCRIGQGYYFSVPLEIEDFSWLLQQRTTLPLGAAANG